MRYLAYCFWLFLLFFGVSFALLNDHRVLFNYYLGEHTLPLPILLFTALFIGVILGFLAGMPIWLREKRKRRKFSQRVRVLEQEIKNLRRIPLN